MSADWCQYMLAVLASIGSGRVMTLGTPGMAEAYLELRAAVGKALEG